MMSDAFTVRETDLAQGLGLSRKKMRALREAQLTPADWQEKDGAIFYRDVTAERLQAALELAANDGPGDEAGEEDGGTPEPSQGVVTTFWSNPRIVGIRVGDQAGRLRVKDAAKFVKGMKVPVRLEQAPDLWVLTCRQPRWKGKF